MARTDEQIRADIVEVGRRLWERGFVASNDGNISVRIGDDLLITTPTGVSKGFMTPDMMVVTDLSGQKVSGERNASSELKMHLEVYQQRPDVRAVVHAHPATATGFAVAGVPLDRAVLAEVITTLGEHPDCRVRHPLHRGAAGGRPQVREGARRHAAGQPRRPRHRRRRDVPPTTGWRPSSTSPGSAWSRGRSGGST